jgi:ABC-type transport system involved in multi-copper enzyme maturation permease subunit
MHSLRRMRGVALAMGAVLVGFQFLLTQVAVVLDRNQAFGALATLVPDFMRQVAGPSMLGFMSFTGIVALGFFHPIVMASLLGLSIAIATEPAAEVETRFDDLTLTRPVPRAAVIARSVLVLTIVDGAILTAMTLGSWTGLTCCTPATVQRPSIALLRSLAMCLGAVVWCWGGLALAAASAARRRAVAAGLTGIVALVAYLVDYLGRVWDPLSHVSPFSPFHYFEPMTLITGAPLSLSNLAILFGIGFAGAIAASVVFARRDL